MHSKRKTAREPESVFFRAKILFFKSHAKSGRRRHGPNELLQKESLYECGIAWLAELVSGFHFYPISVFMSVPLRVEL